MDFDNLLASVGSNGVYQMALFSLAGLMTFVNIDSFAINFLAGRMEHWCEVTGLENLPPTMHQYVASSLGKHGSCLRYAGNYSVLTGNVTMEWILSLRNRTMSEWNLTREGDGSGEYVACERWIYDTSVFTSTIVSRVRNYSFINLSSS